MPEVFFERPYTIVRWDDQFNGIYVQLLGYIPSEDFREILEKALEFLKLRKAQRWIIDLREHKVTSIEDQNWLVQNWIPRCVAAGLKQVATVVPEDVIAQMGYRRINRIVDQTVAEVPTAEPMSAVKSAHFSSMEKARQWMLHPDRV